MSNENSGQGHAVKLPNGESRIDFIRDRYYDPKTHKHEEGCMSRSDIKNEINEMLPEDEQIPYQIVYAATKKGDVVDPRVAARERAEERAKAKAEKEAAAKKEKEEKAAAKKKADAAKK